MCSCRAGAGRFSRPRISCMFMHVFLWRWCGQMLAPLHSLQSLLRCLCGQKIGLPHSLHVLLWRLCAQMPPRTYHQRPSLNNSTPNPSQLHRQPGERSQARGASAARQLQLFLFCSPIPNVAPWVKERAIGSRSLYRRAREGTRSMLSRLLDAYALRQFSGSASARGCHARAALSNFATAARRRLHAVKRKKSPSSLELLHAGAARASPPAARPACALTVLTVRTILN
jgi:hypothetical protein